MAKKKPPVPKLDMPVQVRMSFTFKEALEDLARQNKRKLSDQIRLLLEKGLEEERADSGWSLRSMKSTPELSDSKPKANKKQASKKGARKRRPSPRVLFSFK